jgi:oxygen-independent coproporphyrinogen-3 oxidase
MAGIYIHIPFCASRCIYCAFYSTTSLDLRQQYVDAVCRESGVRRQETEVRSIYLGGGTPSQLTIPQLRQIFDTLYKYNNVAEDAEITIEVNPDDVTEAFAQNLRTLPVNRVSMGAQTFNDQRLRYLHRRHTAAQVAEALERLRAAGIQNISIDLMYGFPDETLNNWTHDIDAALALHVEHLSAYCLSIEEGTPLHRMMNGHNGNSHPCVLPDEETERAMYYLLKDRLESAGLEHYEISNFARPGFRSRHNSAYWNYTPYIGLGAAAHSFDGHTRSWNVADIHQYIKGIERGERLFESETIEGDTRYNDLLTTALRTREGLDLNLLSDRQRDYCLRCARRFIDDGLLSMHLGHLALTRRGLFISDMIISSLMLVTSESTSC